LPPDLDPGKLSICFSASSPELSDIGYSFAAFDLQILS
jgi:hypothetical protein